MSPGLTEEPPLWNTGPAGATLRLAAERRNECAGVGFSCSVLSAPSLLTGAEYPGGRAPRTPAVPSVRFPGGSGAEPPLAAVVVWVQFPPRNSAALGQSSSGFRSGFGRKPPPATAVPSARSSSSRVGADRRLVFAVASGASRGSESEIPLVAAQRGRRGREAESLLATEATSASLKARGRVAGCRSALSADQGSGAEASPRNRSALSADLKAARPSFSGYRSHPSAGHEVTKPNLPGNRSNFSADLTAATPNLPDNRSQLGAGHQGHEAESPRQPQQLQRRPHSRDAEPPRQPQPAQRGAPGSRSRISPATAATSARAHGSEAEPPATAAASAPGARPDLSGSRCRRGACP